MPNNGLSELCREYRRKFPDMPTLKLARIVYKSDPLLFTDVEHVRQRLRYIEGKNGGKVVKHVKDTEYFKEDARPRNPYALPESDEIEYKPYKLKGERILVLSDIHIPYHSIKALTEAFTFGKKVNPDTILLNGDTIDFFGLSRFTKDPKKRSISGELSLFKEFMETLQKTFPKAKIIFKAGNHEERYEQFLWMKAYELDGVEEFEFESLIKTRTKGVEVVKDKRVIHAGHLNIIHGHEFGGTIWSPVNIARGLYLKGKVSALQGHNHQTSEHTEPDMNGKITTTWSTGCLCELHPAYLPLNRWCHGWAFVEVDHRTGLFDVTNKRIY